MAESVIKKPYYTTEISYTGALTNGQNVLLDNSKNYLDALAVTLQRQLNASTTISGTLTINSAGALYFVPTVTSGNSLIKVKALWES